MNSLALSPDEPTPSSADGQIPSHAAEEARNSYDEYARQRADQPT